MRAILATLTAAAALLGAAAAQNVPGNTGGASAADLPANTTGPITVGGIQEVICGAGFAEESVPVDLTAAPSQSVQVAIECNAPFTLDASADYGRLQNADEYDPNDPLTFVPYTVNWPSLLSYDGQAIAPNFTNTGEEWAAGLNASSSATGNLQLGAMTITWGPPPDVIAGDYTDTFELNIVPN